MNAKTKGEIQVVSASGGTELATLDSFLNGQSAALEAMRPAPVLHKRELVAVQTKPDDYAQIKGGQLYLKHSARCRVATAAGVREVGPPQVKHEDKDGRRVTQVFVGLVRPGIVDAPVWGWADGCLDDAKPSEREHYLAKLATRAHARALKKLLGESFLYSQQEIKEREGRFLVACVSPDASDADVRRIMLEKMAGGSSKLYGSTDTPTPPATAIPSEIDEDLGDVFTDADFDDVDDELVEDDDPFSVSSGAGVGETSLTPPGSDDSPAPPLPSWAALFVRDKSGMPQWDSLSIASCEDIVRAELKGSRYDAKTDPAELVADGKAKDWPTVARKLFDWQMSQGVDADA